MNMQLANDLNLNINFNMNVNFEHWGIPLRTAGLDSMVMGISVAPNVAAAVSATSGVANQYYQNFGHLTVVINPDPSATGHPVAM